jgi:purine nucleoside phosphorylase
LKVGVLTGTGTYSLAGLEHGELIELSTRCGTASLTTGRLGDLEIVHISRHEEGHKRLSSQVQHRANILALQELGVQAAIATTICGALDPTIELGSLIVFDDLHFLSNRLPDGELCSLYDTPGMAGRGHWIFDRPFSEPLRQALLEGAAAAGLAARDGGCYGHVDGPRFNTRSEIAMLARAGVSAVSQTAGPEAVLCGEARIPYGLLGYATDYANGIPLEPTPVELLSELMDTSRSAFVTVLERVLPSLAGAEIPFTGTHLSWT